MRAKLSAIGRSLLGGAVRRRLACGSAILSGAALGIIVAGAVIAGTVFAAGALFIGTVPGLAQDSQGGSDPGSTAQPNYSSIYCSGFVRDTKVSDELRLVSGEEAYYKVIFDQGDYVYLNQGANKGFKVGDRFQMVRPERDPAKSEWFYGQHRIEHAMGTLYRDIGQLRIVNVQPKVSIAQVSFSCAYAQRGDIVRPYEERPVPPYKEPGAFDPFAPVSGKPVGMIVTSNDYQQALGQWNTAYVNLGAAQGVKIGDYLRIFRHEGRVTETVATTKHYYYEVYGFGSVPQRYNWRDLPREVLGEGIVLNASRNSSTLLITYLRSQAFTGDEVELE